MRGISGWNYSPYAPLMFDAGSPYICRIAPESTGFTMEWLPSGSAGRYEVFCGRRGETPQKVGETDDCRFHIGSLEAHSDYQAFVCRGNYRSRVRLIRTVEPVGTVVNYLHPEDDCYAFSGSSLCSPSLVRLPGGALLASMDIFEGGAPQNLTLIFRSDDEGTTWHYVTELMPCFWARMFVHRGDLYILACSTEYGDLLIGKSTDEGKSFAAPTVLLRGSGKCDRPGVHKNPQPVIAHNGRLWCTLEWGTWARRAHAAMVMSCPENADLLMPGHWTFSEPTPYDPSWPGTARGDSAGNIEGTLVVAPDGGLQNIMRYDMMKCQPNHGLVLSYRVDTDHPQRPLTFHRALPFPGNHSKFEIRWDSVSGRYYSIVSRILSSETAGSRNLLSLISSEDLESWRLERDLIDRRTEDPKKIGFQYVDFMMEGDDLLYLCRTALDGARNYHDANLSTFHRLSNFRQMA